MNPRPVEPPPPPGAVAAPATAPPVYDAGAALDAYARSCARYAVSANGAVLGALRFGGVCVKPSDESGGAPFGDADLLAVVDAICDPASVARALDLTRVDGARFTQACAARALSHALAKADRGRGLAYLALVGAPLGPRGAERLATAATPPSTPRAAFTGLRRARRGLGRLRPGAGRASTTIGAPRCQPEPRVAPRVQAAQEGGQGARRERWKKVPRRAPGQLPRARNGLRGDARGGGGGLRDGRAVPPPRGQKIRFGRRLRALARRLRVGPRVLLRRVGPDAPRGGALRPGAAGAPGRAAAAAAVALGPRGAGARARRDALPLRRLPPARRRDFSSSPRRGPRALRGLFG